MIKTTGKEFKQYYSDKQAWPDGAWHEDDGITLPSMAQKAKHHFSFCRGFKR